MVHGNQFERCFEDGEATSKASAIERKTVNRVVEANSRQLIRNRDERNPRDSSKHPSSINKRNVKMSKNSATNLLNEKLLPANYSADKLIQRVIAIVKKLQPHSGKPVTFTLAGTTKVLAFY